MGMKSKKYVIFGIILLIVFIMLAGCSGGNEKPEINLEESDNTAKKPAEQTEAPDYTMKINVGDSETESVKLPDNYPSDVFPLYEDSFVASVVEINDGYTITAFSKTDYREIATFYKEIIKNGEVTAEMNSEKGFTSLGKIGGFTYNFDTGASDEMEGYISSIAIILMPEQ